MRELYLINKNNQVLDLLNNRHKFILKGVEGLHGIDTDIAETESPYTDGSDIDNVRALPRGIELTFKLMGDVKQAIDYFTSYVKSKQYVTLREVEDGRDITIRGIATIPPYTRMAQSCEITLSIYCNRPYWEDTLLMVGVIDNIISLLTFPSVGQYFTPTGRPFGIIDNSLTKDIINEGDTSVGALFSITATGTVVNPQITCNTGEQNGWYMRLNLTLKDTDEVIISTVKNNKYITINGSEFYNGTPVLSYLEFRGTDWLQLEQGSNIFDITTTSGSDNVYFNATYRRQYE
jgi:hypothetical protein